MRGLLILAISLWAAGATAEEPSRTREPRAAILEALEVQASLPEQLPRLPDAASPVAESARETATEAARRDAASRTRGEAAEKARREASERAARMGERTPPGQSIKAARSAAMGAAGAGSDAQDAAGRSRAEHVRKNKDSKHDSPGGGRPKQPDRLPGLPEPGSGTGGAARGSVRSAPPGPRPRRHRVREEPGPTRHAPCSALTGAVATRPALTGPPLTRSPAPRPAGARTAPGGIRAGKMPP